MLESQPKNALAGETSPYLLQHADNPVAWYPWGTEALEAARRQDKPILLSIGYSACHWCHVMAHESFEDAETAAHMNREFINIKVDREERPDLDKIYQLAHQMLTHRPGGWPLTLFLTPDDHAPFFAGTYFPDQPRHGMPAFTEVLAGVAEAFHTRREDIRRQNEAVIGALDRTIAPAGGPDVVLTDDPLAAARRELREAFDGKHGGFGSAPKFPHPANLEGLLRSHMSAPDEPVLAMASFSLGKMALGGIYDQIGGGFCRYSVDEQWTIPHFEKMLYDNGPLLSLYAQAYQLTGDLMFKRVALETGAWVVREMQAPEGGYYSSLDADSEGEEGKFYAWDADEVRALLTEQEYAVAAKRYGLDQPPNFENKSWHLSVATDAQRLSSELNVAQADIGRLLGSAQAKLFEARARRVRPGRDDKVLTAWNGLMIKGMATAGRILDAPRLIESAEQALDFVRDTLWRDGRLLATCREDRAHLAAYLDDYAFLIDGILALLETRWRSEDLAFAQELAEVLLAEFEDPDEGGFFFTGHGHETLIHRPKPMIDEATPAGNGVAAWVLGRLGHLLGETRYLDAAERTLRAAWPALNELAYAHTTLLNALDEYLSPPQIIVLRASDDAQLAHWQARCQERYAPRRLSFAIPASVQSLPQGIADKAVRGSVVAYVCQGMQCGDPVTTFDALETALRDSEVTPAAAE